MTQQEIANVMCVACSLICKERALAQPTVSVEWKQLQTEFYRGKTSARDVWARDLFAYVWNEMLFSTEHYESVRDQILKD